MKNSLVVRSTRIMIGAQLNVVSKEDKSSADAIAQEYRA
jgi:hypothetical protein